MNTIAIWLDTPAPYPKTLAAQNELVAARIADAVPDTVLFLEHPPVVTLGNRGRDNHVLAPDDELARRSIALVKSTRGGDVTYHGPGQLVMYPVIHLGGNEADAHGHLHNLEEIAIRTAADFGVTAFRRPGMTGAWTMQGKLAAIGIRLKRWVTSHGMSFNVNPDLTGFQTIVPCGLVGEPVTSLREILGEQCPALHEVRTRMTKHFCAVCRRPASIHQAPWPDLPEKTKDILQPLTGLSNT